MSIRIRLTFWYAFILIAAFMIFGAGVYFVVWFTLSRQTDVALYDTARAISDEARPAMENGQLVVDVPALDMFRATQIYAQVIDSDGSIRSTNAPALTVLLDQKAFIEVAQQPDMGKTSLWSQSQHGTNILRVLTLPMSTAYRDPISKQERPKVLGYLQLGSSLDNMQGVVNNLWTTLLFLGPLVVGVATLAGWIMSRRALQPVDDITNTVMRIYRAENLEQRVDVTSGDEVGRLGSAFNEMLERLSALFQVQQRLVGDVSHELRTPLTVIRGNVDLMRAMRSGDPESLEAISSEADRMTRMVTQLLMLSQADSGQLPMKIEPLDLAPMLMDVERNGRIIADDRVKVTASAQEQLLVQGDRDYLKQVLLNLVENAIKHTPDGGEVTALGYERNDMVYLSVSDTGGGIAPDALPHIFERFYRVDKARSRAQGGAGLGLAIVKSIVDAHGGQIQAYSTLGKGSTFVVTLPAYHPNLV
ncbi:MAG TPA: ATP-binding protein [Thermoflexales bacterium]|nr:ATP-binding protein [Thermoflexales bacterium]HQW35242.1 ATP-binding protein [Thermoflexales bacterium]HQZ20890.1 ATP-binding protein [Thermoflexales bacterium]HRA00524.1 ATP-binding protein [Thermoflexales bacterium]